MERQIMNFRSGFGGASVWTIQFRAVVTALIGFYCLPADIGGQVVDNTPAFGTVRPSGLVHILDIEVSGSYAYAGGSGGFWLIDISSKASPTLVGSFRPRRRRSGGGTRGGGGGGTSSQIYGVTVNGSTVYGCQRTNGLTILDVADSTAPHPCPAIFERMAIPTNTRSSTRAISIWPITVTAWKSSTCRIRAVPFTPEKQAVSTPLRLLLRKIICSSRMGREAWG